MWTYDQELRPPAPFIDIVVRHPKYSAQAAQIRAKIDTAADISVIPITLVAQLGLPIASKLIVKGYDNVPTPISTYSIFLEVANVRFNTLEVIVSSRSYVLLGRDVLNHFYIHLNGPKLTFDLSLTPI